MGQKTNPVGFRVGVIRGWDSNWYENKSYALKLKEDEKLRDYVRNRLKKAGISRIVIDRTSKNIIITVNTSAKLQKILPISFQEECLSGEQ
uniref:Ribosomal protein S3, small subunit ribosomal protein S3 n=1 Tax=uncultured Ignavibacteria bacterium Rifle_16ft_4_minimus_32691 TaxID=1665102 RepID=A0A0H4TBP2_9BACT|nr:Ribosomal protein S3, small subunit ribosomal protein S3 [uncultured Ignavibacteria bacterium Rifle_16ft_4_minimus_32691]